MKKRHAKKENVPGQSRINNFGFKAVKKVEKPNGLKHTQVIPGIKSEDQFGKESITKSTPVSVSALIKRMYRYVDGKSLLVWGLTSDWNVAPVESSCQHHTRSQANSAITSVTRSTSEEHSSHPNTRDTASEGYGEMTAGSIQHLINHLRGLHAHLPAHITTSPHTTHLTGTEETSFWNLTPNSTFIDIGSGYGKVVLHFALDGAAAESQGIEYVEVRASIAGEVLSEVRRWCQEAGDTQEAARLTRVKLTSGDATLSPKLTQSHVYIYDKVFSEETIKRLALLLNRSQVRVFISYQRPDTWRRLGLCDSYVAIDSFPMRTTGSQNFRCHLFLRVN